MTVLQVRIPPSPSSSLLGGTPYFVPRRPLQCETTRCPFFWGSWACFHQFGDVINVSAHTCLFLALLLVSVSIQRIPLEAVPGEARCSDAGGSRRGQGEHGPRSWFGSTMPCSQHHSLHATAVMGPCSEQMLGSAWWPGCQLVLAASFCCLECLAFTLSLTGLFECVKWG